MDKDRIAGSAKDFAGKVEGTVGNMTGDAKTQAEGRAREAAGAVQNLYGQAKDAARDATDAAVDYAKDAYDNSGDTIRERSEGDGENRAGKSARCALGRRRHRICAGAVNDAPAAPPTAALAVLRLNLILRSGLGRVSKDDGIGARWFETRQQARLTMRGP